jgi:Mn-dependent DtxR family transcriptional regulator
MAFDAVDLAAIIENCHMLTSVESIATFAKTRIVRQGLDKFVQLESQSLLHSEDIRVIFSYHFRHDRTPVLPDMLIVSRCAVSQVDGHSFQFHECSSSEQSESHSPKLQAILAPFLPLINNISLPREAGDVDITAFYGYNLHVIRMALFQLRISSSGDPAMPRKRWTPYDREYLARNYATKTRAELAKHFEVSVDSVAHQLWRMGLIKVERWDKRQDQYLRDNYLFLTNKELAKRLKTTPLAINNRLIRLGLRRYFRWTPEAEQYLRDNFLQMSDRAMADALLITPDSVSKKLRRMKLKRPPRVRRSG